MVYENFISKDEQENLIQWAYEEECRLRVNNNSPNRFWRNINKLTYNENISIIRDRIIKKFDLLNFERELDLGDWLGMIKDKGVVNIHTDKHNKEHHRFNVILQLPKEGGMNIYDGKELSVKERMLIYYRPDLHEHGTTRVIGDRHRLNLSFGFLNE